MNNKYNNLRDSDLKRAWFLVISFGIILVLRLLLLLFSLTLIIRIISNLIPVKFVILVIFSIFLRSKGLKLLEKIVEEMKKITSNLSWRLFIAFFLYLLYWFHYIFYIKLYYLFSVRIYLILNYLLYQFYLLLNIPLINILN